MGPPLLYFTFPLPSLPFLSIHPHHYVFFFWLPACTPSRPGDTLSVGGPSLVLWVWGRAAISFPVDHSAVRHVGRILGSPISLLHARGLGGTPPITHHISNGRIGSGHKLVGILPHARLPGSPTLPFHPPFFLFGCGVGCPGLGWGRRYGNCPVTAAPLRTRTRHIRGENSPVGNTRDV